MSEIRVRMRAAKPAEPLPPLMQPMEPIAPLRVCAAHAGELDRTAVGLLAELPDRIEAPGLPARSTTTFGAPEKVP